MRDLNTAVGSFPGNLIADFFRFEPREFFELEAGEQTARQPVAVKF
ncbi:MAG: LemA family protein [Patescibacteria group bacterium]